MRIYVDGPSGTAIIQQDIVRADVISLDVEASKLDVFGAKLFLLQIKLAENIYIFNVQKLGIKYITYILQLIKDSNKLVIGHNIKYDLKILLVNTQELLVNVYDTMIAEHLFQMGLGVKYASYKELVEKYEGEIISKDVRNEFIDKDEIVVTEEILTYSAIDVLYLESIREKQLKIIEQENLSYVLNLEMKLLPAVVSMECNGIKIDVEKWKHLYENNATVLEKVKADLVVELLSPLFNKLVYNNAYELFELLGIPVKGKSKKYKDELLSISRDNIDLLFSKTYETFNINSPQQLLSVLKLNGIDVENTNEKTINKVKHKIVDAVLNYRELEKKFTSFGEGFLESINPITGKVHTDLDQIGAATGRFSSKNPNLQNIVRDSDFRECFIADSDEYDMITADYSQAELRLLADVSREPLLLLAYEHDDDVHLLTATGLFGISREEVTKDQRRKGKNVNFATVYGSTEWGLYKNFGIELEEGREFLLRHKELYPTMYKYIADMGREILKKLYSVTPFGRKRYFTMPTIFDTPQEAVKYISSLKRKGVNHIIQGGSADITKLAIVLIFYGNPFGDKLKLKLTVHDEILVMVHKSITEQAEKFVVGEMNRAGNLIMKTVRSKVDSHIGSHWSKE